VCAPAAVGLQRPLRCAVGGLCCRYGKGDAVSQWSVDGISMKTLKVDSVAWFKVHRDRSQGHSP
jgi:hypothetical protein